MTKEELKAHCEKQVKMCEEWAKGNDREPSGKIYEEHKLILELLEQQPSEHITCKCCKYWIEEKHRKGDLGICECFSRAHVTCHLPKDFYCKFAERKEEE